MISFRFHVVSITAVFLAIAIGVVVGSTFVDRAIVDNLEERIDTVSGNLDERRAEIARLEGELGRLEDYVGGVEGFAVSGQLAEQPLLVVAVRGVDETPVRELTRLARLAGAVAPGVLWVEPRWALDEDEATAELAELADRPAGDADDARAAAWEAAVAELVAPEAAPVDEVPAGDEPAGEEPAGEEAGEEEPGAGDPTIGPTDPEPTEPPPPEDDPEVRVLTQLLESGFLSFERDSEGELGLESVAAASPAVVLVTGPGGDEEVVGLVTPLVEGLLAAGLPTVVAEVYEDGVDAETGEAPARGDTALAAVPEDALTAVSVVDHLDLPTGRVAAVLAVADLRRDVAGHYGFGDGASGPVPAFGP